MAGDPDVRAWRAAAAFAAYLPKAVGVGKVDRVAAMLPNVFALPISFMAGLKRLPFQDHCEG